MPTSNEIWDHPRSVELDYRRRLQKRAETARDMAARAIGEFRTIHGPEINARASEKRTDSLPSNIDRVSKLFGAVRLSYFGEFTEEQAAKTAEETAIRADKHNAEIVQSKIQSVLGVPAIPKTVSRRAVEEFTRENVDLITSIPEQYFDEIEAEVISALEQGKRVESLAEIIDDRFEVASNRATLIARDQLGSLNAQVNGERQQSLGVSRYVWRSSRDERVRPSHNLFNGQTYTWEEGSPEGHPGEPIQCRCTPDPIIEDLIRNDSLLRFWDHYDRRH